MSAVPTDVSIPLLEPVPSPQPRGALTRLRRLHIRDVAVFGAFMAIFAMALRPVVDNDLFWHLATGRYMWSAGQIPHADLFSWTVPGRAWIAHEWLTELWLYPVYAHGGYAALMLIFATVISVAFAISYLTARRLGASRTFGVAITLLAAVASSHTWGVRPQMLSMLLMAVTFWLLVRGTPWPLPVLMALWANLHGGFIFGLALVAIFAAGHTCNALWSRLGPHPPAPSPSPWRGGVRHGGRLPSRTSRRGIGGEGASRLWLVLALSVIACVLNPNGLTGLTYPFSYLGNNASTRYIAEWVSPDFHQFQYQLFEALLLALIVGAVLSPRRPWTSALLPRDHAKRIAVPLVTQLLLILAFTHLALDSVRNINLFAVIVAPFIAIYLSSAWRDLRARIARPRPRANLSPGRRSSVTTARSLLNAALAATIAGAVLVVSAPNLTYAHNAAIQARRFPAGAVAYLRSHQPAGPMLNSYDWGGYLIWALYPRMRVYVDGRPDMYGDRFMDQFVRTWQAQPGWQDTLRHRGVRLVLVEPTSGLGRALASTRGWRVVYHDAVSVLYARTG